MNRSKFQKDLADLRVAWFRGQITAKEVLVKTLDRVAKQHDLRQDSQTEEQAVRETFNDLAWHCSLMKARNGS